MYFGLFYNLINLYSFRKTCLFLFLYFIYVIANHYYCRIGIYGATKISRKGDFSFVLRVFYFASEQVLQHYLLNETGIKQCQDLSAILRP